MKVYTNSNTAIRLTLLHLQKEDEEKDTHYGLIV